MDHIGRSRCVIGLACRQGVCLQLAAVMDNMAHEQGIGGLWIAVTGQKRTFALDATNCARWKFARP